MRILVLRVIPAMTGIRPKHISHLWVRRRPDWVSRAEGVQGFTGIPDTRGQQWFRRDFRQKKIKCSRALAVGAGEPPAFAVAGGDLPLRKPSKGRDLGLETAWDLANVGSHSSTQRSRLGGVLGSSTAGGRVAYA